MLGCLTSTFWVPARIELLDRFASRHPGANVTTQIGAGQQLLDSLSKLHLDLAFVSPVEGLEAFDYIRLQRSRPGLFVPRTHRLLQKADTRMSDLAGLPLASMGRAANPGGYDQLYGPYFRAGMIEREVPEGSTAMLHYARAEGLCLLAINPAEEMGENMIYRDVIDTPVSVEFGLARRSGDERLLVQRLWSVAQAMAEESGIMRPRRKGAAADSDDRMPKQVRGRKRKGA
jgi:DNA-binding transcriptional LysR family regulator